MAELVALRLVLPSRLARQPLDTLLRHLTLGAEGSSDILPSVAKRDLLLAERGVARLPGVASTCLYRSLARYAILRRSGLDAVFVMGLAAEGLASDGHAWIELGGEPFAEPASVSRYAVTFRYPPAQANERAS